MTYPAEYADCDIEPGTVITQSFTYLSDHLWQLDPLREGLYLEMDGRYVH